MTTEFASQAKTKKLRPRALQTRVLFCFWSPFLVKGSIFKNAPLLKREEKEMTNYAPHWPNMGCFRPDYAPWYHNPPLTMLLRHKCYPLCSSGNTQRRTPLFTALLPLFCSCKAQILNTWHRHECSFTCPRINSTLCRKVSFFLPVYMTKMKSGG